MTRKPAKTGPANPRQPGSAAAGTGGSDRKAPQTEATTLGAEVQRVRISALAGRKPTPFRIAPDAPARAAIAEELGLSSLPRLEFDGRLEPQGSRDWHLRGRLLAEMVQPCIVTLAPVTTRVDEPVERIFAADWIEPEGEEVEMPEDDRIEPLTDTIDLGAVMAEALSLTVPLYPRAEGAELGQTVKGPPGSAPLTDEAVRPFAGLEALKARLGGKNDDPAEN